MIADPPVIPEATLLARKAAAARYPETLVDTMGREHPNIARKAILEGHWDDGSLVRSFITSMDEKEASYNRPAISEQNPQIANVKEARG